MGHAPSNRSLDDLLSAQRGWVQRLAARLVGPEDAEDVAQDALVQALRRPPRSVDDEPVLRAWLARVTRNLARHRLRERGARLARERQVARRDETEDAAAEVAVELAEPARALVAAVLALPEPVRAAVLLHYFEGRTTGEIARATGATEAAVRKRLSRARERLRERLDERWGDRRTWTAGLAAWVVRDPSRGVLPATSTAAVAAGVAMTWKLGVVAGAAVLTAGAVWTWVDGVRPPEVAPPARAARVAVQSRPSAHSSTSAGLAPQRAAVELQAAENGANPSSTVSTDARVEGSVRDEHGTGIAGAHVAVRVGDVRYAAGTTDDAGRFDLLLAELPPWSPHTGLPFVVEADAPDYVSGGSSGSLRGTPARGTADVALREGREWIGRVVDGSGRPMHATVHVLAAEGADARSDEPRWSDEDGWYRAPLPECRAAYATAFAPDSGYAVVGPVTPGEGDVHAPDLVLAPAGVLTGRVTTPAGRPIPALQVFAVTADPPPQVLELPGDRWWEDVPSPEHVREPWTLSGVPWCSTETDSEGRFALRGLAVGRYRLETGTPLGDHDAHGIFETGSFVELTDGSVRALRVHVVDEEGLPLPGSRVSVSSENGMMVGSARAPGALFQAAVPAGRLRVVVGGHGSSVFQTEVEVDAETDAVDVVAVLDFSPDCGRVRFDVEGEAGEPSGRLRVTWQVVTEGGERVVRPAHEFDLDRVPVGRYVASVSAEEDDWLPFETSVEVHADQETTVPVRLRRGARLSLLVRGLAPEERENAREQTRITWSTAGETRLLLPFVFRDGDRWESGAFRFEGLPELSPLLEPGTGVLRVEVQGYRPLERTLTLMPGATTPVELDLLR